jgi:hypothetical protein
MRYSFFMAAPENRKLFPDRIFPLGIVDPPVTARSTPTNQRRNLNSNPSENWLRS